MTSRTRFRTQSYFSSSGQICPGLPHPPPCLLCSSARPLRCKALASRRVRAGSLGKQHKWFLIPNSYSCYWVPPLWVEQPPSEKRYFSLQTLILALWFKLGLCQGQVNLGYVSQFFSSFILSAPTSKAGRQEFGTLNAFCGQSCPLQLLHKSAKEILYILRNRVDFTRNLPRNKASRPKSPPPLYCQGM